MFTAKVHLQNGRVSKRKTRFGAPGHLFLTRDSRPKRERENRDYPRFTHTPKEKLKKAPPQTHTRADSGPAAAPPPPPPLPVV